MDKLIFVLQLIIANWQRVLTGGVILTCAIIFLMGVLKKAVLGKIGNKLLRKVVLAFSSVILVFPATALYFVADGINFDYYWYGCAGAAVATILTYWLYENTGLRNVIDLVGEKTVYKYLGVLVSSFTSKKSNATTKVELISVTTDLQTTVREEVAKAVKANTKVDEDLNDV